ncbi:MAG: hypothetical protein AB7I35_12875 [Ramlibacter sp.]
MDPFGRSSLPAEFTREDRVRTVGEVFEALRAGRMPAPEKAMFVAAGVLAWLEGGGHLTRDYWKTAGPQGSTHTESVLWRQAKCSSRRATGQENADTIQSTLKGSP